MEIKIFMEVVSLLTVIHIMQRVGRKKKRDFTHTKMLKYSYIHKIMTIWSL